MMATISPEALASWLLLAFVLYIGTVVLKIFLCGVKFLWEKKSTKEDFIDGTCTLDDTVINPPIPVLTIGISCPLLSVNIDDDTFGAKTMYDLVKYLENTISDFEDCYGKNLINWRVALKANSTYLHAGNIDDDDVKPIVEITDINYSPSTALGVWNDSHDYPFHLLKAQVQKALRKFKSWENKVNVVFVDQNVPILKINKPSTSTEINIFSFDSLL